ncbi:MAG: hypothetical protein DMG99_06560 [Acidobacteria bacterium]|nr:MAG: hypothetical protein DMG99_06560 [Acidobacteriota bacterium]
MFNIRRRIQAAGEAGNLQVFFQQLQRRSQDAFQNIGMNGLEGALGSFRAIDVFHTPVLITTLFMPKGCHVSQLAQQS